MPYNEKKKNYDLKYQKEKLKSLSLRFQIPQYEKIQAAAKKAQETVGGYIKKSVEMRMQAESDSKED